ncbi:hypothetical protein YM304_23640 [Ilumatobacter coccineus YM16-304]|jgi:adenylate kinase family enzyme|uniref:Adenylate kinase n=2 Tax=Ilumatobacter coccineus TaxID=467094 RepID=A0A6C7EDI6_ILUCY|nr:hypothetical protein YM304_23640 [Ilumatobacter coccineus YM16-304]
MRRVVVVGAPGSGKSTVAAVLAERLGAAHIELDELFHRPDWAPTPTPEFRAKVAAAIDVPRWVVAGNYVVTADLTHARADTIVWLDLGRRHTIPRVAKRSIRRAVRREQLWNGNRERLRDVLHPKRSMIAEAWNVHRAHRAKFEQLSTTPLWAHADVHRFRTPSEVTEWLASVQRAEDRDQLG